MSQSQSQNSSQKSQPKTPQSQSHYSQSQDHSQNESQIEPSPNEPSQIEPTENQDETSMEDQDMEYSDIDEGVDRYSSDSDPDEYVPSLFGDSDDSHYPGSDSSQSSGSSDSSQEIQVPIKWKGKKKQINTVSLHNVTSENCIICQTRSDHREYLTLDFVHELCDKSSLGLENWDASYHICSSCFDDTLTETAKEKIEKSQNFKKILCKEFSLGFFPLSQQEEFIIRRTERAHAEEQMRAHQGKFNLNFLTNSELLKITLHTKSMIRQLLSYAKIGGLKKGDSLACDEKMIIFLCHIRLNLSYATLSVWFKVSKTTVARARNEVEKSLAGI